MMSSYAHGVMAAVVWGFVETWLFAQLVFDRMSLTIDKFKIGPEEAPNFALQNIYTTLSPIAFLFGFAIYFSVAIIHALLRNTRTYPLENDIRYNLSYCDGFFSSMWMGCMLALLVYLVSWSFYDRRVEGQGVLFFFVTILPMVTAFLCEGWRMKRWWKDVLLEAAGKS